MASTPTEKELVDWLTKQAKIMGEAANIAEERMRAEPSRSVRYREQAGRFRAAEDAYKTTLVFYTGGESAEEAIDEAKPAGRSKGTRRTAVKAA